MFLPSTVYIFVICSSKRREKPKKKIKYVNWKYPGNMKRRVSEGVIPSETDGNEREYQVLERKKSV